MCQWDRWNPLRALRRRFHSLTNMKTTSPPGSPRGEREKKKERVEPSQTVCREEGRRRWQAQTGSGCESERSESDNRPIKQRSLTRLAGRRHPVLPEARRWMSQDEGSQALARPFVSIKRRFSAKGRDVARCLRRRVAGQGGDDEMERAQKVRPAGKRHTRCRHVSPE